PHCHEDERCEGVDVPHYGLGLEEVLLENRREGEHDHQDDQGGELGLGDEPSSRPAHRHSRRLPHCLSPSYRTRIEVATMASSVISAPSRVATTCPSYMIISRSQYWMSSSVSLAYRMTLVFFSL